MFVIAAAIVGLFFFLLYHTRANRSTEIGGIDPINTTIVWIAFAAICGALIFIHLLFARQLLSESKGVQRGVESW